MFVSIVCRLPLSIMSSMFKKEVTFLILILLPNSITCHKFSIIEVAHLMKMHPIMIKCNLLMVHSSELTKDSVSTHLSPSARMGTV